MTQAIATPDAPEAPTTAVAPDTPRLAPGALGLLALASAIAVANGYYVQPLLGSVSRSLAIPAGLVGILPALSQIGLACGLALILPLGDILSARRLLLVVIPLQIAALILFAAGASAPMVAAASLLIGLFGITPYVLPPYASLHVSASRRGHVTGVLARGVIIGILLARTVSGTIATRYGWRAVYWLAAILMAGELVLLLRIVRPPAHPGHPGHPDHPRPTIPYRALILSLPHLLRTVPELRTCVACVACSFGSFNVFWLGATLYLQAPPFRWTPQGIGLVAVIGAISAAAAPIFGRAIDRTGPRRTRTLALAAMLVAWLVLAAARDHLAGMAAGLVVLDIAATVVDISNRTILYGLDQAIRTRLNAVYQVAMFTGGAAMSVLIGPCWSHGGWLAVCALGACPIAIAIARTRRLDEPPR